MFFVAVLDDSALLVWTCSSTIGMTIVKDAWSEVSLQSGWIVWLSISLEPQYRNIRSIMELASWQLSEYLVRTWLVGIERPKLKLSVIIKRLLLREEWWG